MQKKQIISLVLLIYCLTNITAQNKHNHNSIYPTYKGLIMAGYQGWFHVEEDGTIYSDQNKIKNDMWPDVSEYQETYPTGFKLADGSVAKFFNSSDKSTIDLHFKWMKEYGLDGVFVQRFFNTTRTKESRLKSSHILKDALHASSVNERAIAVMYDLSGLNGDGEDCSSIIEDWKFLVDEIKVTNQEGVNTYLHHNSKPIVAIWGVGFPDRPYNIRQIGIERLIDFFKNDPEYGGCTVMLGIPTFWRDLNSDCIHDPYLHEVIRKSDIILPWMVQRFSPLLHNDMDRYRDVLIEDMKWCRNEGIDYVPSVYPGFSWHNLSRFEFPNDIKPAGSIPRMGGKFYWQLLSTAINTGAEMIYVAMFDEVNEGTAIFKLSDNPPVSDVAKFVGIDGKPSDYYLWLTGEASKMLKRKEPLSLTIPIRK